MIHVYQCSCCLMRYKSVDANILQKAIRYAIDIGYRHFDCAWAYNNESFVGPTILDAIAASRGAIKREDLFIVSKVWDTFHSKRLTKMALNETLRDMGLSYIDLYLIHWPIGLKVKKRLSVKKTHFNVLFLRVCHLGRDR